MVKRAHWLLLRNPANLKDTDQVRLAEVLGANHSLMMLHLMKDALACIHGMGVAGRLDAVTAARH